MKQSRKPTGKIFNNGWNSVERTTGTTSAIMVDPFMDECYDDATTSDIMELYTVRNINKTMHEIFSCSPFYEKYKSNKRIDKNDLYDVYVHFRDALQCIMPEITYVQMFIGIAEFFDLNYETMYNDIISIEDKSHILECLKTIHNYNNKMNCPKLF